MPIASEADDEGTCDMLAGFIKVQEKTVWMLSAWLGSNSSHTHNTKGDRKENGKQN